MSDSISDKDKEDWIRFIKSNEKLHDKENFSKEKKNLRTRSIDLHGYSLKEANLVVKDYINKSFKNNISKIIIVTGKGIHSDNEKDPYVSKDFSILKYSVPEFIKKDEELMSKIYEIKDADIKDGGEGAILVKLRNL